MLLFGRMAAHVMRPVSSGCDELIVSVVRTLVALLKTPRTVVFIAYRELFISLSSRYHLMVGCGLASNWQLQLFLVFMNTMLVFGRRSPRVGATVKGKRNINNHSCQAIIFDILSSMNTMHCFANKSCSWKAACNQRDPEAAGKSEKNCQFLTAISLIHFQKVI